MDGVVAIIRGFVGDVNDAKSAAAWLQCGDLFFQGLCGINDHLVRCGCESCRDPTGPNYPMRPENHSMVDGHPSWG
jgi:hypothetical protein